MRSHLPSAIALAVLVMTDVGAARDNGQWNDMPAKVREWFQKLMQPDHPWQSCCGEADAYEADSFDSRSDENFVTVIITDGKGVIANGTRFKVPDKKMKVDAGNPTGHGILFIGSGGEVYCYVLPGGA
jgi:hypothetical protein